MMRFVNLEQLESIEEREDVERVENNGVSGQDGKSTWYTVYYTNGEEEDIYWNEDQEK